jgi:hypothetical protein
MVRYENTDEMDVRSFTDSHEGIFLNHIGT